MTNDTDTKTLDKVYEPDKDPEAKSGTDQFSRVERKSRALKISIWIGIPTIAIVIILWVLHNWFGYWLVKIYTKYDFADRPCEWMRDNLPFWFIGKGLLKNEGVITCFPYYREDAADFLFDCLDNGRKSFRIKAWKGLETIIIWHPKHKIQKNKFIFHVVNAINNHNKTIQEKATQAFFHYNSILSSGPVVTPDGSFYKEDYSYIYRSLIKSIESEQDPNIKEDLEKIISFLPKGTKQGGYEWKEVKENVRVLVELLREYHKKNKKP